MDIKEMEKEIQADKIREHINEVEDGRYDTWLDGSREDLWEEFKAELEDRFTENQEHKIKEKYKEEFEEYCKVIYRETME